MPVQFTDVSFLLIAMFIIVGLTNVITEVIKLNIGKPHPNIICTVVAIVLTVAVTIAYCQVQAISLSWIIITCAVVFGFVNAFVAMSNFDKLLSLFKKSDIPIPMDEETEEDK